MYACDKNKKKQDFWTMLENAQGLCFLREIHKNIGLYRTCDQNCCSFVSFPFINAEVQTLTQAAQIFPGMVWLAAKVNISELLI